MPQTSREAGYGTGVEYTGTNYPFVNPSTDVRGLFADFWLGHERRDVRPPFSIAEIHNISRGFGLAPTPPGAHSCDVVVVDADDVVVCDTRNATYAGRAFGDRFFVHEWIFPQMVCRAVQHRVLAINQESDVARILEVSESADTRATEDDDVRLLEQAIAPFPAVILPVESTLDERTYELLPQRVQSIQVGDDIITGNIRFEAGWNISFDTPQSTIPVPELLSGGLTPSRVFPIVLESLVRISAIAGAGAGPVPGCPDPVEVGLRTINQVPPEPKGNFKLDGLDCIFVMPPHVDGDPATLIDHALQIGNHCGTCRPCDKYVDIYQQMTDVYDRLKDAASEAEALRDLYNVLLADVNKSVDTCVVPIRVAALGGSDAGVTVITLSGQITNTTPDCYEDVELSLHVDFQLGDDDYPIIVRSASYKTFDDGHAEPWYAGTFPDTVANWTRIRPGGTVRVQYAVLVGGATGPLTITGTGTVGGQPLPLGADPYTATMTVTIG